MDRRQNWQKTFFAGLNAFVERSFPKHCKSCGKTFNNPKEYIGLTNGVRGKTGLIEKVVNNERTLVELYRDCSCGSTLMEIFEDRRDQSENGLKRRKIFSRLMKQLIKKGYELQFARQKLFKILYGQQSI